MSEKPKAQEERETIRAEQISGEVEFFSVLLDPDQLFLIIPAQFQVGEEDSITLSPAEIKFLNAELYNRFGVDPYNLQIKRRYISELNESSIRVLQTNQSDRGIYLHESVSEYPIWAIGPLDAEIQPHPLG